MHVLLAEDDRQMADTICGLLFDAGFTVEHVVDGDSALRRVGDPAVDVLVLDRMLPALNGLELLARMRRAGIARPVLILSALGGTVQRVEGLDHGADDYLAKPFEPDELIARLRALVRRLSPRTSQPILFHGDIELNIGARTAHRRGRHLALSPKEFELLRLLMEHSGEIVTRELLLRHVWNLTFDPQTNVIDVNLGRLRRKLEEGFDSACLETVRGRGYRLVTA